MHVGHWISGNLGDPFCSLDHSRLWNRIITKNIEKGRIDNGLQYNGRIFDSIIITVLFLKTVSPDYKWLEEIHKLILDYKIETKKMGFPEDWEDIFNSIK
jgi:abortive infection bacteriophage resistance protein